MTQSHPPLHPNFGCWVEPNRRFTVVILSEAYVGHPSQLPPIRATSADPKPTRKEYGPTKKGKGGKVRRW